MSDDIHELKKTSLLEFWNSEKMKQVRLDMIAGTPIKECNRCYEYEKLNVDSLRVTATRYDPNLSKIINNMSEDGSLLSMPNYFDHRTIHCNFQCISCGSFYSSTHINLKKEMWNVDDDFVIDHQYEKQSGIDIIESLNKKECTSLYWAGGEPFMSHVHWSVVDHMYNLSTKDEYKNYIKNVRVHYNTNLSKSVWKNKKIVDLINFYQPSIQASIDGTHETFEYCRDGGNWETTSKNWEEFYSYLNKNRQFGIASVLSSPVIMDIDRWFDFFEKYDPLLYNHRYIVNVGLAKQMSFLDIKLFPTHIFNRVVNHAIDRFSKSELRGKHNTINILESYIIERNERVSEFENNKFLKDIKAQTMNRDKYLKINRTYDQVLKIIDTEAYEWYMNI
jgi:hypothetical protein